jgi:hypothetical protein
MARFRSSRSSYSGSTFAGSWYCSAPRWRRACPLSIIVRANCNSCPTTNFAACCACSAISSSHSGPGSLCEREPFLTDDLIQEFLRQLGNSGLVRRGDDGAWALTRDLATTTLYDLYAGSDYRLPSGMPLPGSDGAAPDAFAARRLDEVIAELRERMKVPLSEIFPAQPRSNQAPEPKPPVSREST